MLNHPPYRKILRSSALVLVALLLWQLHLLASPKRRVVVGINRNYPPYEYEDEKLRPSGFNADLIKLLVNKLNWEPILVTDGWANILDGFENGSVELLLGMIRNEQNSDKYTFSIPHSNIHYGVFHRKNEYNIKQWEDIEGLTVFVQAGDAVDDVLLARNLSINRHYVPDYHVALDNLSKGIGDLTIAPILLAHNYLTEKEIKNIRSVKPFELSSPYCFSAKPENKELIEMLDREMTKPANYADISKLQAKWFGSSEAKILEQSNPRKLIVVLTTVLGFLCFFSFFLCVYYERQNLQNKKKLKECLIRRDQAAEELGKLHKIYDNSPLVVMKWYDAEKELFDYISQNISDYGYQAAQFTDRSLNYRDIIHPDDLKHIVRQRFDHLKANDGSYWQQYRLLCPSDNPPVKADPSMEMLKYRNSFLAGANSIRMKWVADKTEVMGLDTGGFMTFVGFLIDISKIKELEQEIAQLIAQTRSEKQTRSLFLLSITYETKAPLHQFAEAVEQMSLIPLSHEQETHLERLRVSIERLKRCIDQIEEYLQLDSMQADHPEEMRPILDLFYPLIDRYGSSCSLAGLDFEYKFIDVDYLVLINDMHIIRAVDIVLENALKFTPSGLITTFISFTPQDDQSGTLSVDIKDSGAGIPEDLRNRIFEPFNQIDNSYTREFGGLGLGLAILSRILELSGGNILLTSEENTGTTVKLSWIKKYKHQGDVT